MLNVKARAAASQAEASVARIQARIERLSRRDDRDAEIAALMRLASRRADYAVALWRSL